MPRVIKFRAWDTVQNLMHDWDSLSSWTPKEWLKSGCILMQFIGLFDKKGIEIYEGDVVKVPVTINQSSFGENSYREIKFNNGSFLSSYLFSEKGQIIPRGYTASFIIEEPDLNMKVMLWSEDQQKIESFEVIGNIYDNPSLLERAKEV